MQQLPSIHWIRRIKPLNGNEDLLKQNPLTDVTPQEERIPVDLISDFVLSKIKLINLGNGVSIINGKNKGDLKFSDESLQTAHNIFAVCEECINDLSSLPNHF